MTECSFNLLKTPFLHLSPHCPVTLPGLLALLVRDEVESYPALRPHQAPAWHMFLVQLAALALHRAGASDLPDTEAAWAQALRGLTQEFPDDEPWCLVVEDASKPAFMQPPVPEGVSLPFCVLTPDLLDHLSSARNHDLKQAIASLSDVQDWVFSLVSLQTMAPYGGGKGGYSSIARIKSGWSYRPFAGLAPSHSTRDGSYSRLGTHFQRDVKVLLATRSIQLDWYSAYKASDGNALLWTIPWEENRPLIDGQLDIWFVEVCRRIRVRYEKEKIVAYKGTAKGARVNLASPSGDLGDPWAPVNKEGEMLSLGIGKNRLDYRLIVEVFINPADWKVPLLARCNPSVDTNETYALIIHAISHDLKGNSTGQHSRILPISGKMSKTLGARQQEVHVLAKQQVEEIVIFDKALGGALALAAAGGNRDKFDSKKTSKKEINRLYAAADEAKMRFNRAVDEVFFDRLWARFEAQEAGQEALEAEEFRFASELREKAEAIFEAALPSMPCARLFRPRAEARARRAFRSSIHRAFPELFCTRESEELSHANA